MAYPPCRCRLRCQWLSKLSKNIKKVKREVPAVFEILIALAILCVLLLVDVIWLGHVHALEIKELDQLHGNDLGRFRKQFDSQMHALKIKHKKIGSDLEDAHAKDVNKLKVIHQQELEKKINSIQEQLNGLLGMSKNYWDKHAEQQHIAFPFDPSKLEEDLT